MADETEEEIGVRVAEALTAFSKGPGPDETVVDTRLNLQTLALLISWGKHYMSHLNGNEEAARIGHTFKVMKALDTMLQSALMHVGSVIAERGYTAEDFADGKNPFRLPGNEHKADFTVSEPESKKGMVN